MEEELEADTLEVNAVASFDVGQRHLALCVMGPGGREELIDLKLMDLGAGPPRKAVKNMISKLDSLPSLQYATSAALEAQPRVNPTMKAICHAIQTWFLCRRGVEFPVHFVSPCLKLTVLSAASTGRLSYQQRKKQAVTDARALLPAAWKPTFESHIKKDDLADAFLQALVVIGQGKLVGEDQD
tara:strand:- start:8354 stop:8905 length:552 start_codon:yes stop_codon:yes gene_type:complete